jgi:hypothetical protein
MHLRDEAVQGANAISVSEQLVRDVRADEACAAGDQDMFSHSSRDLSFQLCTREHRKLLRTGN